DRSKALPGARSRVRSRRDLDDVHFLGPFHPRSVRRFRRHTVHRRLAAPDSRREPRPMSSTTTEAACLQIPLAAYPSFNRFTLDWMAGDPNATQFLERRRPAGRTSADSAARPEITHALIESNR